MAGFLRAELNCRELRLAAIRRPATAIHLHWGPCLQPLARLRTVLWYVVASLLWVAAMGLPGATEESTAADWQQLQEKGWFSRGRQAAKTEAARQAIDDSVTAVDQADRQRTAWLEQTDRWQPAWEQPGVTATAVQTDRLVAWGSRHGLELVALTTGRPAWGAGPAGGGPLFPRLRPAMRTAPHRPGQAGPVAIAAGRLVGLIDRPSTVAGGPLLVALDLAPAAEGRLIWTRQLEPASPPVAAGVAATASVCFAAWPDGGRARLELISLAAADGGLRWRCSVPLPAGIDQPAAGPVRVACVQHLVVVALPTGLLVGLTADSGRECWRTTLPGAGGKPADQLSIDALATTADRLIVLRRPEADRAGCPEICRLDLLSGRLLEQCRPTAVRQAAAADRLAYGPPLVRGGHVIWPVGRPPAAVAGQLMICRLTAGNPTATGVTAQPICHLADIVAESASGPSLTTETTAARRLVVTTGQGLWCLEPVAGAAATVQSKAN